MNKLPNLGNVPAILAVAIWFLGALVAGWSGIFSDPAKGAMYVGLFVLLPLLYFSVWYIISPRFRDLAHDLDLSLIVGAHVWRYVGLGFVLAFLLGRLPAGFGIPEGLGDVIAAIFALPLALALRRGKPVRGYFVLWNIFGLADLLSAISVGILYSPGSLGLLRTGISTAFMATFPVSLIPTFLVPFFILLHVLALLRRDEVGSVSSGADVEAGRHRMEAKTA